MEKEQVIADALLDEIQHSLSRGNYWIAYNSIPYFLEKSDLYCFKTKDEAEEFASNNISEYDNYMVISAASIADVFRQIQYGQHLEETISLSIKTNVMEQNTARFNDMQLMRSGFAEAITPALKTKMAEGVPVIEHHFKKEYEGDKVDATLHLKKSASSDLYFLNKFDLQLQKEGQADSLKQTFYINRAKTSEGEEGEQQKVVHENRYTLKEAYNLMAGRPVYKHLVSKEEQPYEAWVKINFKNTLDNGNHEMKQYHKNYGFDLESTLARYPIQELANDRYRASLIDSLQRGNLQKVTFAGQDGKEEKLYISPNITLGALNVYDSNKQRLTTEQLVDKQYIGKDLAEEIKQRASQQQQHAQTQKQETGQSVKEQQKQLQDQQPEQKQAADQKHKNDQKQKPAQKLKDDNTKQKQPRKHKVN